MKINCDVCRDLLPLVLDGVASKESERLVREHLADCPDCRDYAGGDLPLEGEGQKEEEVLLEKAEKDVLKKIKKRVYLGGVLLLGLGLLLGIFLSNTAGMFYNILLMPLLGMLAYALFRRKGLYFVPLLFLAEGIRSLLEALTYTNFLGALSVCWVLAGIYSVLVFLGVVIAALFSYSFSKGDSDEREEK